MILYTIGFPQIVSENEKAYLAHLQGIIESVDMNATTQVSRRADGLSVRISPSGPDFFPIILSEIKSFHSMLNIRVEFSKSMKSGNNIFFNINFDYGQSNTIH